MVIKKTSIATYPTIWKLLCYLIYRFIVNVYCFLYISYVWCVCVTISFFTTDLLFLKYMYIVKMLNFFVFSATFSNISAISWRPVLVVEEAGVTREPPTIDSNWSTLSLAAASRVHPFCNLQSRERTHAVLVIGLYELLCNLTA